MPKILLVEDNEMNRDMLSRRLVRGGYEVTIAEDGARGVAVATSDRPDLILMDMRPAATTTTQNRSSCRGC
jgi:CheY-like chemotaxis protein